jgi:transposase-like protein
MKCPECKSTYINNNGKKDQKNTDFSGIIKQLNNNKVSLKKSKQMKSYSLDIREKIVTVHLTEKMSIRKVAIRFDVSKSLVQKLV